MKRVYWEGGTLGPRLNGVIEANYTHGGEDSPLAIHFIRVRWANGRVGTFLRNHLPRELHRVDETAAQR